MKKTRKEELLRKIGVLHKQIEKLSQQLEWPNLVLQRLDPEWRQRTIEIKNQLDRRCCQLYDELEKIEEEGE